MTNEEETWSTVESPNEDENKVEYEVEEEVVKAEAVQPETKEPVQEEEEVKEEVKVEEAVTKEIPQELEGIETKGAQRRIKQLIRQRKERDEQIQQLINEQENLRANIYHKDLESNK